MVQKTDKVVDVGTAGPVEVGHDTGILKQVRVEEVEG